MKFKNLNTETGKFSFAGSRVEFNGTLETEDKELIEFLKNSPDFVCVDCSGVCHEELVLEQIPEEIEEESGDELTELKKYADELGVKYHHRIGLEKLQEAIDKHLSK